MSDYIAPAFRSHPLATEFNAYLAEHCIWAANDFGSGYAWETEIPPLRETWGREVNTLNEHLRSLDR